MVIVLRSRLPAVELRDLGLPLPAEGDGGGHGEGQGGGVAGGASDVQVDLEKFSVFCKGIVCPIPTIMIKAIIEQKASL